MEIPFTSEIKIKNKEIWKRKNLKKDEIDEKCLKCVFPKDIN